MLRNLLAHCESEDVKRVLEWSQNQICGQLTARVDPGAAHPTSQRVHALYSLVNIAAAGVKAHLYICPSPTVGYAPGFNPSNVRRPHTARRHDAILMVVDK